MKRIILFVIFGFVGIIEASQGWPRGQNISTGQPVGQPGFPRGRAPNISPEKAQEILHAKKPIQKEKPKSNKLSIEIYIPDIKKVGISGAIKEIQSFILRSETIDLLERMIESQVDAPHWIALMYLQQVGSAYKLLESLNEESEDGDKTALKDIISFNYANEHMPATKKELYLRGLIEAIDYILHRTTKEWKAFLNNTTTIKRRPTDVAIEGIRIDSSLVDALDAIKAEYPNLSSVKTALDKESKEIGKEEKKVQKKEQKAKEQIAREQKN